MVVNAIDGESDRRVWYQYWDSQITYRNSYLARLNYVMQNPVKHGLIDKATKYPSCSAHWFLKNSDPHFLRMVIGFKFDSIKVMDPF
ncbi:MAG: hypothetical protein K940chlam3_00196 [Chlamydiae bacterium]|nr:hypothetical protein [Chlamydiota bacterium]